MPFQLIREETTMILSHSAKLLLSELTTFLKISGEIDLMNLKKLMNFSDLF